jgi:hypothetical protein
MNPFAAQLANVHIHDLRAEACRTGLARTFRAARRHPGLARYHSTTCMPGGSK